MIEEVVQPGAVLVNVGIEKDLEKPLEQTMEVIEDKVESFEEVSEVIDLQEEKGRSLTLTNGQFAA